MKLYKILIASLLVAANVCAETPSANGSEGHDIFSKKLAEMKARADAANHQTKEDPKQEEFKQKDDTAKSEHHAAPEKDVS